MSEALLDLEINEKTESDKDKAWWEAGNTGKRRSSFSQRRGAAYDGEYDDDNGRVPPISNIASEYTSCRTSESRVALAESSC